LRHAEQYSLYRRQATAVRDLLRAISQERAYPLERGREFQVEGADTEKLLAIPGGLVKRFVLEKCKDLDTRSSWPFSRLLASFSNLAGGS